MTPRETSEPHGVIEDVNALPGLRSRFPRWHIRQDPQHLDGTARWHATRLEALGGEASGRGLHQVVSGATAEELAAELEGQERLHRLVADGHPDPRVPNIARMYDYFLGGEDNLPVDRVCAERVREHAPEVFVLARENRAFLGRAVRHLTAEAGLDQFLDLGAGLPTRGSTHQVARSVTPAARVVYVDRDPAAVAHASVLLASDDLTWALRQDVRAPERILAEIDAAGMLDLTRPVAVLLVAVLHFVTDAEDPHRIVATLMGALPSGSHLVVTHGEERPGLEKAAGDHRRADSPVTRRTAAEIRRLFGGLTLVDPGLVQVPDWRPGPMSYLDDRGRGWNCGGVGRKP